MSRPRMRALLSLAAAGALAAGLLLPGVANAGAASKFSDHFVELFCGDLTGNGGTLFFDVSMSDSSGLSAGLVAWPPGAIPFVDPLSFQDDGAGDATGSVASAAVSVDIPLVDDANQPAGTSHIEAALLPDGPIRPIDQASKSGNHQSRERGTFQSLAVSSGTATLPGGFTFALDNDRCTAQEVHVTDWGNDPTSDVSTFSSDQVNCDLEAGGQAVANLYVNIEHDGTTAFIDAFFSDARIDATADGVAIDAGHLSTGLDFRNLDSGAPAGTGSIDLTFAADGQPFGFALRGRTQKLAASGEIFRVSGTLVAPGFGPFDLGGCLRIDQSTKRIIGPMNAPKPTGTAPSNDAPAGATPVHVGSRITEQTKNTAVDAEVPFDCLTPFDLAGIKTVWFEVTGTGSPVTVGTAGTAFDTVIDVYTSSGGAFDPVPGTCVDDPPVQPLGRTLQAAVTFTAAAGTTYLVQVGGVDDDLNWGTLKVSVR